MLYFYSLTLVHNTFITADLTKEGTVSSNLQKKICVRKNESKWSREMTQNCKVKDVELTLILMVCSSTLLMWSLIPDLAQKWLAELGSLLALIDTCETPMNHKQKI